MHKGATLPGELFLVLGLAVLLVGHLLILALLVLLVDRLLTLAFLALLGLEV